MLRDGYCMNVITINEIVVALLLQLQQGYGIDQTIPPPRLNFLTTREMTQMACTRPCNCVQGWTPPGHSVYLHEDLSIEDDLHDKSVLLHELVHYIQYRYQLDVMATECQTWKAREARAYQIQIEWLHKYRVSIEKYGLHRAQRRLHGVKCLE